MTSSEISLDRMIAEAEAKGKELEEIEARNRKRRAKGRKVSRPTSAIWHGVLFRRCCGE